MNFLNECGRLLPPIVVACLTLSLGCGSGEIPSAVEQPQEVHARFVTTPPVFDGRGDDAAWQQAAAYKVFVDNNSGGFSLPENGVLLEFKALWWKASVIDTSSNDTSEVIHIGFLVTWPDAEKNVDRDRWTYDPTTQRWTQSEEGADWLMIVWNTAAKNTDLWYWDAAATNPMGCFDDMEVEGFDTGVDIVPLLIRIDNLNYFNDTPTAQNAWDLNYDDNKTPRDFTDDSPRYAWTNDPKQIPPSLPPVYSQSDENMHFLLDREAAVLASSAYKAPIDQVAVPAYYLEQPAGGAADVRVYGRHENGRWTLEFFRPATGSNTSDVPFNPEERFFSQNFSVALGNNAPIPFSGELASLTITNNTLLTFEFKLGDQ